MKTRKLRALKKRGLVTILFCSASVLAQQNQVIQEQTSSAKDTAIAQREALTEPDMLAQSQQKTTLFATQLKTELVNAIQSGGLEAGVSVCHTKAPEIAQSLSTDGWSIGRTSVKTRNELNVADEWERQQLQDFDTRYKQGEAPSELVSVLSNEDSFRYMKAIPMDKVCLACHGKSIDQSLQERIQQLYPTDRATGFSLEDIRGAFVVEKVTGPQ